MMEFIALHMMELMALWGTTIITSFGLEIANELRLFKDVADAGYKIDVKRMSDISKQLNPNSTNALIVSLLIPGFNIFQVFQRTNQYNQIRPTVLTQLDIIGALEEMTDIEKAEYQKSPTSLNAFLVPLGMEKRIGKAISITFEDETGVNQIFFEVGDSLEDITILKATGNIAKLSVEEQKNKIIENGEKVDQKITMDYESFDHFYEEYIDSKGNLDMSDIIDGKETQQSLSIGGQKQNLQELKQELLEEPKREEKPNEYTKNKMTRK